VAPIWPCAAGGQTGCGCLFRRHFFVSFFGRPKKEKERFIRIVYFLPKRNICLLMSSLRSVGRTKKEQRTLWASKERKRNNRKTSYFYIQFYTVMKEINYMINKEGKYYVSQCLNVDISSFGATIDEASANLNEALQLYFEDDKNNRDLFTAANQKSKLTNK
jgi:predicted RNase H-like HicB family nuclease